MIIQDKETLKRIRGSHLMSMQYCWKSNQDLQLGFHTKAISDRIDKAFEDFGNGKSSYISIAIHPRSGKSDLVSRFAPPMFLGKFPYASIISSTYNSDLVLGFANDAMNIIRTPEYQSLYPDIKLAKTAASHWQIKSDRVNEPGNVFSTSLYAGLNGRGAHLAILDDYLRGRKDAESFTIRDTGWNAFTNDFMTRLAPVHIVIILATSWHVDDIRGRIKEEMSKNPDFPKFEFMDFPAKAEDYTGEGKYPNKYLFQERYSEQWYRQCYAVLGTYASAALFDCNPTIKGGAIIKTDKINYHDDLTRFPKAIKYARVWDLGHSKKSRKKKDPDYTGGTLLGFKQVGMNLELRIPIVELYVKNYTEIREGSQKKR